MLCVKCATSPNACDCESTPLVRGRSRVQSSAAAPSQVAVNTDIVGNRADLIIVDDMQGNAPISTPSGDRLGTVCEQALSVLLDDAAAYYANKCWPEGYRVADKAPEDWKTLRYMYAYGGKLTVWNGASDRTVFSSPQRNWDFRAWHDWCHLTGGHDFSAEGERAACVMQQEHVKQYGDVNLWNAWEIEFACNLLDAEVNGQRAYKTKHGVDVLRQRDFDMAYIMQPQKAMSESWA